MHIRNQSFFFTFYARVSRLTRFWIIFLVLNNIDIFETKNHLMSIVSTLARKIYVYARLYLIPDLNNKIIIKYMFTQSSELWILYSVQCTVYNNSVQCTVYNVQCTMYTVQCTVYNVPCTIVYISLRKETDY